jgi:hypothetical protein
MSDLEELLFFPLTIIENSLGHNRFGEWWLLRQLAIGKTQALSN